MTTSPFAEIVVLVHLDGPARSGGPTPTHRLALPYPIIDLWTPWGQVTLWVQGPGTGGSLPLSRRWWGVYHLSSPGPPAV